jgi:HSP20 family protein
MAISKVSSSFFVSQSSVVTGPDGHLRAHWEPNTDVYITDHGLVIKVELAGMRSEHLEITVEGSRIRIRGERPDCCRGHKCSFLVMNISYGPFESILELPAGYDLNQAKAAYLNGFLRIDVPLAAQTKPKCAKVSVTSNG